jgi:tRNA threonylcarbamoyladenosine biosynthesis protein TsaB
VSIAPGITLAIDASTYEGSVAVLRDGVLVAEKTVAMRGETEERLMPAVHESVAAAGVTLGDVGRVVCGEGPGSFTSLRIAGSIAKGVAFANDVPLFAVSSLALIVAGAHELPAREYVAALDAMRGESYVARCRREPDGIVSLTGPTAIITSGEIAAFAADGGSTSIGPAAEVRATPHARGVARMLAAIIASGPVALDGWEPKYGRLAEAQVKWEAAQGRPLSV